MSYSDEKVRPGRRPITIVEIDLDTCGNDYSTAPCTAAIGVTGTGRCYKTRATCQDPSNYNRQTKTYRYCTPSSDLPLTLDAIPSLRSVTLAPTRLDLAGSLGQRSSVTIILQDHTHHDRGVDPYWSTRDNENDGVDTLLIDGAGSQLLINGAGDRLRID